MRSIRRLVPGVIATLASIGIAWFGIIAVPHSASSTPTETALSSPKVQQAVDFLETVGFKEPTYRCFTAGRDGEFPTFRVTTLNGKTADLWVRTFPGGGMELRLAGTTMVIASANDLAHQAQDARSSWHTMSAEATPKSAYSKMERARLQARYHALSQYAPRPSYWSAPRHEDQGWPR